MSDDLGKVTVLAISSAGGHWIQLRRLRPAWKDCSVTYASTLPGYALEVADDPGNPRFVHIPDASRASKLRLAVQAVLVLLLVVRLRPTVVVSTGASIGYFAIRCARMFGSRTIWIDSIANVEELSYSGQLVGPHCDVWLTQWPELAEDGGPEYCGTVV